MTTPPTSPTAVVIVVVVVVVGIVIIGLWSRMTPGKFPVIMSILASHPCQARGHRLWGSWGLRSTAMC